MGTVKDLVGQRFGYWHVQRFVGIRKHTARFECLCNCGEINVVKGAALSDGSSKSCGCFQRERAHETSYKHGFSGTPEAHAYVQMLHRCYNKKNKDYTGYGGRGISVCKRWLKGVKFFIVDMGMRPDPFLSLDRINNNGNYEPKNCRWATKKQQQNNRRTCKSALS